MSTLEHASAFQTSRLTAVTSTDDTPSAGVVPASQPIVRSSDDRDLTERLATLTRRASEHLEVAEAVQSVVLAAAQLTDCALVDVVTVAPSGELRMRGSTAPELTEVLIGLADRSGESLARDCVGEPGVAVADPLNADHRRSYAGAVSAQTAIRAELDVRLAVHGVDLGVMRFFALAPGHFTPERQRIGLLAAEHAAVGVHAVTMHTTAAELKGALDSNRRIGMAMGILMSRHAITEAAAFDLLRTASQRLHRKLRTVADDVVIAGELPPIPTAERSTRS